MSGARTAVEIITLELIHRPSFLAPLVDPTFADSFLQTIDLLPIKERDPSGWLLTSIIPRPSVCTAAATREETRSLRIDAYTISSACLASHTTGIEHWRRNRRSIDTVQRSPRDRYDVSCDPFLVVSITDE